MHYKLLAATALSSVVLAFPFARAAEAEEFDWSGPYLGATLGGIWSDGDLDYDYGGIPPFLLDGPSSAGFSSNGWIGGVTAGYNIQRGRFVFGIEADASFADLDGSENGDSFTADEELESLLTMRARFGVAKGPLLAYGTVGLAGGSASFSTEVVDLGKGGGGLPSPAQESKFVGGVVVGGGLEYAVNDKISIKGEALYYDLSSFSGDGDTGKGAFTSDYNPSGTIARVGLNFHF